MKRITLPDVRAALCALGIPAVEEMSDRTLKNADFFADLHMDEGRVSGLMSVLEQEFAAVIPSSVADSLKMKNTVAVFITVANGRMIYRRRKP